MASHPEQEPEIEKSDGALPPRDIPAAEKPHSVPVDGRVRRKVDLHVLPLIAVLYLCSFLCVNFVCTAPVYTAHGLIVLAVRILAGTVATSVSFVLPLRHHHSSDGDSSRQCKGNMAQLWFAKDVLIDPPR
jgi:hypothetical protein